MKRRAVGSIGTLLAVVVLVAVAVVVGPRLLPLTSDEEGIGGPPPSSSPDVSPQPSPSITPEPTSPDPTTPGEAASSCFDPAAPAEPVVFTNPDGPAQADTEGGSFAGIVRELPTFAGLWVSEFRGQFHIALTCDVEAAIAQIGHLIPRGTEIHFHLVEYTYAELDEIRQRMHDEDDELFAEGIFISCWGVDEVSNRLDVCIDPLTPAVVDEIRRRFGEPIIFEHVPRPEPIPSSWPTEPEVLVAIVEPADREPMVTCGGGRSFPASLLDDPAAGGVPDDMVDDVVAVARFWRNEFPGLEQSEWRLVHRDDDSALFLAPRAEHWLYLGMKRDSEGWAPAGIGGCAPMAVLDDGGPARWWLDPAYAAPGPDTTELHILVSELACAGGLPAFGRMSVPLVAYGTDALTLTVGVRPLPGGATCPGNPPTPAIVILPEPLGERELLDGGRHPPAPPAPDY